MCFSLSFSKKIYLSFFPKMDVYLPTLGMIYFFSPIIPDLHTLSNSCGTSPYNDRTFFQKKILVSTHFPVSKGNSFQTIRPLK